MWTDESRTAELIIQTVENPVAQRLLYQAQTHLESFRHASSKLKDSFELLLFHDFARTQSCHMTDGIFGADIHLAKMESAKVRVWGFLLGTATAGHRFLRCIKSARSKNPSSDWAVLRDDLKRLTPLFLRTRNFLEHLDEKTYRQEVTNIEDCKFSRHGILEFADDDGKVEFDFTDDGLAPVEQIWTTTVQMLKTRSPRQPLSQHPLRGALKGMVTVAEGVDLTEPADPDWGKVYDE
jgi:hypothetical protein